jgi:hydrophobic/amphiphilic exporter-1 (mainly G- bacteria), HAE1 family
VDFIKLCIARPVGVSVGVLLVVLFGLLALTTMPVQLTPTVDVPIVTVTTSWIGASPPEVEEEIIKPQEEQLRSVEGLKTMTATARDNGGEITLEFYITVDKNTALREVNDALRQVADYPQEVDEPSVAAADTARDSEIAWLILYSTDGNDEDTPELYDFAEDFIQPEIDNVDGVGSTDIYGGMQREIEIIVDPEQLATRGLTYSQLESALRGQNTNISAGTMTQGKRNYTVRTLGKYERLDEVRDTVVAFTPAGPVYVSDVAAVREGFKKQYAFVRSKGQYVLAFPIRRQTGANVITTMEGVRAAVAEVNEKVLAPRNLGLELVQVYDETIYIYQAMNMVRNNILIGGVLAITVLLLFLRNWRATLVVALAIPVSVIGTFLILAALGRTLNVISLAGIAFAVGMVVDSAIVVLENIYRHYQMGKSTVNAAYDGAKEVWGPVLASTLTTMAVFIPVILIEQEAGQLFRDISLAVVVAVGLALLVSLTVIPTLATRLLAIGKRPAHAANEVDDDNDEHVSRFARVTSTLVDRVSRNVVGRGVSIAGLLALSVVMIWIFIPPASYLPTGNRNLVFGFVITPPGYSVGEFKAMATETIEPALGPYWSAEEGSAEKAALDAQWEQIAAQVIETSPEIPQVDHWWSIEEQLQRYRTLREWRQPPPPIDNFFFVSFNGGCFMGATSADPSRVKPLEKLLTTAARPIPGTFSIFNQRGIFDRRLGGGNTVEVEIRGTNADNVNRSAGALFGALMGSFGQPRPEPTNFSLGRPEVQIAPDRERAADLGLTTRDVGFIVEAAVEGAYVGDFIYKGGDTIDLTLKMAGYDQRTARQINQVPIYSPRGGIVPLESVTNTVSTSALEQILRIDRQRAVKLTVTPPEATTLETVLTQIQKEIVPGLRQQQAITPDVTVALTGNADKLGEARTTLVGDWAGFRPQTLFNIVNSRFFLSVLIVYLLMAALYESWAYPLVIMFSVPLAIAGGFFGLTLAHWGTLLTVNQPIQQLDVVTFLGFVILVGIVVNNAILLVDQALLNLRERGCDHAEAIKRAVAARTRPIFMTSLTTIAGQLPLALMPAAGSELYRGLAAVMIGGLFVASIGTLLLVPCVLSTVFSAQRSLAGAFRREQAPAPAVSRKP